MVHRSLQRGRLEKQNRDLKKQKGKRYEMFDQEFGDVFEHVYQQDKQEVK